VNVEHICARLGDVTVRSVTECPELGGSNIVGKQSSVIISIIFINEMRHDFAGVIFAVAASPEMVSIKITN